MKCMTRVTCLSLIEKNKNRFVFIPLYGLKWILKNMETLIG